MKRILAFSACVATLFAEGATISDVIVRQQWPWSTDIKVEYKLSGVTEPVDVTITAYNGSQVLDSSNFPKAIKGDRYAISTGGVKSFMIDSAMAFGTGADSLSDFKVVLTVAESPDNMSEVLYKIFDLASGECEDVTRAQLLNGEKGPVETDFGKIGEGYSTSLEDVVIWTGVTNNIDYKTTHLVMRKIPAAGVTWLSGDEDGSTRGNAVLAPRYHVKLTQDYFIGVFELTQDQYYRIYNKRPSGNADAEDAEIHPVENFTRPEIHGNHNKDGTKGVITGEVIMWPTNSYLHDVGQGTALDTLRNKTKVEFDLPMSAQWEFACRAGTTGPLYSGKEHTEENAMEIAWCASNTESTQVVGGKPANAFGLYDMLGNVSEYVHDQGVPYAGGTGSGTSESDPMIDPLGILNTSALFSGITNRVERGGSYKASAGDGSWKDMRAGGSFGWPNWTEKRVFIGARLVCPVEAQWGEHPEGK